MEEGKKEIRKWSWALLVFWILGMLLLIGLGSFLGTLENLSYNWSFYVSNVVIILTLIGLFLFKKWGFYLFTAYFAILLIESLITLDFLRLIIYVVVYGYLIGYRGLYKNLSYLE